MISLKLNKSFNMITTLLAKVEPTDLFLQQNFYLALNREEKKSFQTSLNSWFSF